MTRDETSELVEAVIARMRRDSSIPSFAQAETVLQGTTPTITVDGGTSTVQVNALADPAGEGETVWYVRTPAGPLVLGRAGGARLMGYASATVNQTGITTNTALSGLSVDFVVTQPNRVIRIDGLGQTLASNSTGVVIGRINVDGVAVGRWGRYVATVANDARLQTGFALQANLDPGGYTATMSLECNTAGSVTLSSATVTSLLTVSDAGQAQ